MLKDNSNRQTELELICIEDLVPQEHLLRKIDKNIDFKFVRDKLSPFYCKDNGRPAIDPVVLFKILLIGYLYGIRSERQLMEQINVNIAYRWFLGYKINEAVPHHSTLSINRNKRFHNNNIFQEIFDEVVFLAIAKKLVTGEVLYTDSTHLKANANKNKFDRKEVLGTAKNYLTELEEAVNEDRLEHGKKELKKSDSETLTKETRVSTTDPESGFLMRDGKEECFAYLDHRTVDAKHNIITDVHVTPGNIHDSIPYIERLDKQIEKFGFDVNAVGLDAGYNTVALCHELVKRDIFGVIAYKSPSSNKNFFRKKEFFYDAKNDFYLCPNNQKLTYKTTRRDGYREYVADAGACASCPMLKKCCENKQNSRTISRHVWEEDKIEIGKNRLTKEGKEIYKRRKETVERSFADAKQLHGYRYARFRGLFKVGFQCLMTAICQNIKKIAMVLEKNNSSNKPKNSLLLYFYELLLLIALFLAFNSKFRRKILYLKFS